MTSYEIDEYAIWVASSKPTTNLNPNALPAAVINYFQNGNWRGHMLFFPDGTDLRDPFVDANSRIFLTYNLSQFPAIVQILQVEKPLIVFCNSTTFAGLCSGREPVGEEEWEEQ